MAASIELARNAISPCDSRRALNKSKLGRTRIFRLVSAFRCPQVTDASIYSRRGRVQSEDTNSVVVETFTTLLLKT
jgi:hypothetical protein